jgi:hypothetical protein
VQVGQAGNDYRQAEKPCKSAEQGVEERQAEREEEREAEGDRSVRRERKRAREREREQERVRERERERESVRDERGVHYYNSCACSKKASSSIRTNNIGI